MAKQEFIIILQINTNVLKQKQKVINMFTSSVIDDIGQGKEISLIIAPLSK